MKCSGGVLGLLVGIGGMLFLVGCNGPASAPTSFASYKSKEGAFKCDYPQGWELKGGGKGNFQYMRAQSGSATIRVETDVAGSLIGDIVKSTNQIGGGNSGEPEDKELAPVAKVHQLYKRQMEDNYGSYQEQPAEVLTTGLGDSRRSEFTAAGSFGGKIHGYRVTALTRDLRVGAICECADSDWNTLKPAFEKVITSLSRGD